QRVVQRDQLLRSLLPQDRRILQLYLLSARSSLLILVLSGVVNEYVPHYLSRDGEKVCPILPLDVLLIDQAQIRFIDESRGLKSMAQSLPSHIAPRKVTQRG